MEVFCQRLHGFQFRIITCFGFAGESNLGLLFAPRTCIVQKRQDSVRGCLTCLKYMVPGKVCSPTAVLTNFGSTVQILEVHNII